MAGIVENYRRLTLQPLHMADRSAIILFAHGAREPDWALPFERLRDRLRASGLRAELAYLGSMPPALEDAAAVLVREGRRRVIIVPMFLAQGGHLKEDLPKLVAALRAEHAGVEFEVTPALGDAPEMIEAMAAWVQRAVR
jgi:sirohydrochlorin cobaltochelatase